MVLGFALDGLPGYGRPLADVARTIVTTAPTERVAGNTVIDVAFDYRALDTLVEEFMIFVSAVGAVVLLRTMRDERDDAHAAELEELRAPSTSDIVRASGALLAPLCVVLGIYVVTHGHLSPGGGFQGGVVLAAALVFVYVSGQYVRGRRAGALEAVELADAIGAAAFALIGFGGLVFAASFFENFLSPGTSGSLISGGTIPLSNMAVGVEVAGAFALVFAELLDQVVLRRKGAE